MNVALLRAAITSQINQKFEKFQIMPEAPEFSSGVVSGVGVVENDVAGIVVAEFVAGTDAAVPLCGGINL